MTIKNSNINQNITKIQNITKVLKILQKKQNSLTMLSSMQQSKMTKWQILISTILSARSKDETTIIISKKLFKKYKTAKKLAQANPKDVQSIIKKSGFYKNKTKNIIATSKIVAKTGVPNKINKLLELPGVGRKVAGCVLVYAFNKDAIPVDTHVHRISNRLGWVKTKTPEKTEIELEKIIPKKYWQIINEVLVWYGKTICKPISPKCSKCIISKYCKKINVKSK